MRFLKESLDEGSGGIVEMPTGSGKTASMFSLVCSYKLAHPERISKIIFCTRTVSQLEKAASELKLIQNNIEHLGLSPIKAHIISSRRNLCLQKERFGLKKRIEVDSNCKKMTKFGIPSKCEFYTNFEEKTPSLSFPSKTMDIEDLLLFGKNNSVCPYFSSRALISDSDFILCNYPYLIDYRANEELFKYIDEKSVILIDEAHNIDDVCMDSLSLRLDKNIIDRSMDNLSTIQKQYNLKKEENLEKFESEYRALVDSARTINQGKEGEGHRTERILSYLDGFGKDKLRQLDIMPGSLRKVNHFFSFIRRLVNFFLIQLKNKNVLLMDSDQLIQSIKSQTYIDEHALLFASQRLRSLIDRIQFLELEEIQPLTTLFAFVELTALFEKGFKVIFEPLFDNGKTISPSLQLVCLDPSIAFKGLSKKTNLLFLTSGTMTPLSIYSKVLSLNNIRTVSIEPPKSRGNFLPMIVTRANDLTPLTTEFNERGNTLITKNYGLLLLELVKTVPDGIVVFFPSYSLLEDMMSEWSKLAIIEEILKHKLLFIESRDQAETNFALAQYSEAINRGRGAVFSCVARGKTAEGIDFKDHLGRCALVIGIPFQYTRSRSLLCKMDFFQKVHGVSEKDYIIFDAIRQVSQCIGRVIRGKSDYGAMILADRRFTSEKREAFPKWIRSEIQTQNSDLQINLVTPILRSFVINMSNS